MKDARAIEMVKLGDLREWEHNPREITDEALAGLQRGIERFGVVDPFVVRREDRRVLGGHQRLRAARQAGIKQVPVVWIDGLGDFDAAALNVLLNNEEAQGEWMPSLLADRLDALREAGREQVVATGFGETAVDEFLASIRREGADEKGRLPFSRLQEIQPEPGRTAQRGPAYSGDDLRQVAVVFETEAQFADAIDRLQRVREAEGLETNAEVLAMLLSYYAEHAEVG